MKLAVLSLGLWLAGAQAFAAQACCSEMPTRKAACDSCGHSDRDPSPRPDCCTALEAQKDVDAAVPSDDLPKNPIVVSLLTEDTSFAPRRSDSNDLVVQLATSFAEGPPLYLRYEVFLI